MKSTAELGRLLDVRDAAAYMDMTEGQLRRHIAARRVRVLHPGRKVQIYESWLDEFRATFTVEPAPSVRGVVPAAPPAAERPTGLRGLMPPQRLIRVQ